MPANLTPAYKEAEGHYRRARDPAERLDALKGMLRAIPKHKGTEHLQADIKAKIKELTDELAGPSRKGAKTGPPTVIRPDGAGQIALLGPPNTGKSALHARLTGSHAQIGKYPFTTQYPMPGMMPVRDVHIQLVDLPPIAEEHPISWISNALHPADGCLLVIDLSKAGCVERVVRLHELLGERRIELTERWPSDGEPEEGADLFTKVLPTLLVANKFDEQAGTSEELAILEELAEVNYPFLAVSAETGQGLDELGEWLFGRLEVVRVYTKIPGKDADMERPYTVRHGATVIDVAKLVHKEVAADFKFARLWGDGGFDAQQVGRDHIVEDGDILEIHS
ncbi:MAG: GTPase [Actinomycetota bacterium]